MMDVAQGAHLRPLAQPHVPRKGRVHLDDGIFSAVGAGGGLSLAGHAGPSCVGAAGGGSGASAGIGDGRAKGELDDDILGGGAGVDENIDERGGQIEEAVLEWVEGDSGGRGRRGLLAGGSGGSVGHCGRGEEEEGWWECGRAGGWVGGRAAGAGMALREEATAGAGVLQNGCCELLLRFGVKFERGRGELSCPFARWLPCPRASHARQHRHSAAPPLPARKGVNKRALFHKHPKPNPLTTTTSIVPLFAHSPSPSTSSQTPPPTLQLPPEYPRESSPEIYSHGPASHYEAGCRLRQSARCVVLLRPRPPPPKQQILTLLTIDPPTQPPSRTFSRASKAPPSLRPMPVMPCRISTWTTTMRRWT